jgi:hypothetical protein
MIVAEACTTRARARTDASKTKDSVKKKVVREGKATQTPARDTAYTEMVE